MKFVFCHSELRKRLFCENFEIPASSSDAHARATPLKSWCDFKRINIILNSEICWILYTKWNVWQISFNCLINFMINFNCGEREFACFVYLCHHPSPHFTKLLTRALFFGPCQCSYNFIPCLAFRVHVAGNLDKTISFVVGVLPTSLALHSGSSVRARAALCNKVFFKT